MLQFTFNHHISCDDQKIAPTGVQLSGGPMKLISEARPFKPLVCPPQAIGMNNVETDQYKTPGRLDFQSNTLTMLTV
jgi:hypothetical protein